MPLSRLMESTSQSRRATRSKSGTRLERYRESLLLLPSTANSPATTMRLPVSAGQSAPGGSSVSHYNALTYSWFFISTSRDMTARLYTVDPLEGFMPKSFGGHRDVVLSAFFSEDEKTVSIARLWF